MRGPSRFSHPSLEKSNPVAVIIPARKVYCISYDVCLVQAVRNGWRSWECNGCDGYQSQSFEQNKSDMEGLLRLWHETTREGWR